MRIVLKQGALILACISTFPAYATNGYFLPGFGTRSQGLGGVGIVTDPDVTPADAVLVHPFGVRAEVLAHRAHGQRRAAEKLQAVGDVTSTAAELAAHGRHLKRDVQDVHLVGQDVVLEPVLKDHDGVVGEGTANQGRHVCSVDFLSQKS
mgnify:CR=1 FL=1